MRTISCRPAGTEFQSIAIVVDGQRAEALPHAPGVYRFFGTGSTPLYIGKSIHIHNRVRAHLAKARQSARHHRLMSAVQRIDCTLTVGELGALLLENVEIKQQMPLYNRRQRRVRKPFTLQLRAAINGFLRPDAVDARAALADQTTPRYGLFRHPSQMRQCLVTIARRERLCQRVLGLATGCGPCFARQLQQCGGACTGEETPAAHNQRLIAALAQLQLAVWPWPHPVLLREQAATGDATAWYLVDQWCYLGSFSDLRRLPRTASAAMAQSAAQAFDLDSYHILLRALRGSHVTAHAYRTEGRPRVSPLDSTDIRHRLPEIDDHDAGDRLV